MKPDGIQLFDNKIKENKKNSLCEKTVKILDYTILQKGKANFIMTTGASQFDFIDYLDSDKMEWSKTKMFH